ncbi:MAG: acetylornithine deacetylase [Alphaproteobacteria bacterium]|nr:acetylornithine deacetylase [Alphaproteobacteria bacterium]
MKSLTPVEMIRKLVGFDTTSRESNLKLIDFARDWLDGFDIKSELVFDGPRRKANLFATIGPSDKPGLMLSGHSDVVPVDGQDWHSEPFQATEKDGRLYARGSSDMKSFIAVVLALVPEFAAAKLKTPIHLGITYDEEVGCLGVRPLIAALAKRTVRPRLCIIGEPTMMQPVIANKGKRSYLCRVRGHESHSALAHAGVNAVEAAAEIVAHLKAMARQRRKEGPFDRDFIPPYSTIHVGTIQGGIALNIVPRDCRFEFEIRDLPGDDAEAMRVELERFARTLLPEMQAVSREAGIVFEELNVTPPLSTAPDAEIAQLAGALSGANAAGKVSYTTEGGLYQQGGIPTVICGPGSIEQAHRPDEFIALDQVKQCEAFMRRLLERCAR